MMKGGEKGKAGESFLSLNERDFLINSLREENLRLDGRRPYDFRKLSLRFGPQLGQVEVTLGVSRVYATTSAEVVEPFPDRPTEGFFIFNTELSAMASPSFEGPAARPSEYAIEVGRVVERALRESRAIDTETLCIVMNEKVWSVRCDITILDHDGNLIDCASIAAICSLLHFKRPDVTISGETVTIHNTRDREPVALSIHHIPICITFGFFEEENLTIVDPILKEELVIDGRMTIAINEYGEICAVQKSGGTPLEIRTIIECSKIAALKANEIITIMKNSLKESHSGQAVPLQKRAATQPVYEIISSDDENNKPFISKLSTIDLMEEEQERKEEGEQEQEQEQEHEIKEQEIKETQSFNSSKITKMDIETTDKEKINKNNENNKYNKSSFQSNVETNQNFFQGGVSSWEDTTEPRRKEKKAKEVVVIEDEDEEQEPEQEQQEQAKKKRKNPKGKKVALSSEKVTIDEESEKDSERTSQKQQQQKQQKQQSSQVLPTQEEEEEGEEEEDNDGDLSIAIKVKKKKGLGSKKKKKKTKTSL